MFNISILRGVGFNAMGKSVHTPSALSSEFSVLKVGVPSVKYYRDAGNKKIHKVVTIRKVMGWFLTTEGLIPIPSADTELLQD